MSDNNLIELWEDYYKHKYMEEYVKQNYQYEILKNYNLFFSLF